MAFSRSVVSDWRAEFMVSKAAEEGWESVVL